jgi:aspartyl-tRNA(Asn)/glutamyl-tRNA(Gln) amidotransferase subunit A
MATGRPLGPLHGIPLALKDLYETQGVRTTAGTTHFSDYVPQEDAAVVTKLKAAGAVLLGKANLHEIALGLTNVNPHFGPCHNPWGLDRVSGGSSGGSAAALAARFCLGALGTDTGGSIRAPASLCGVVGLKPTHGRVSLRGVIPWSWNLDQWQG